MLLCHHAVPFALCYVVVVLGTEKRVTQESCFHLVSPQIGIRIPLFEELLIHGLRIIHLIDIAHGLHREEDDLSVTVALVFTQREELLQGSIL